MYIRQNESNTCEHLRKQIPHSYCIAVNIVIMFIASKRASVVRKKSRIFHKNNVCLRLSAVFHSSSVVFFVLSSSLSLSDGNGSAVLVRSMIA